MAAELGRNSVPPFVAALLFEFSFLLSTFGSVCFSVFLHTLLKKDSTEVGTEVGTEVVDP